MDTQVGPHLLGIKGLTREQVELFLHTAEEFSEINERAIKKVPTLREER
jgi:aspartate carbamoyltransferase catalytic subunit